MTTPDQPQPQPSDQGASSPLADWPVRAGGALIDLLPVIVLNLVFAWFPVIDVLVWLASIAYTAYLGYMEGVTGQTPGKAIMGIRLVNEQGDIIGSGPGIGRKFAHVVDSAVCLLGWLLPLVDAKRQTIADKLLQTYVVTGAEKKPFAVELWTQPPQQGGQPGGGPQGGGQPEGGPQG